MLFDGAERCGILNTSVGGWRLLLLGISGGGAVLAAVLAVLWFKVLTRPEKVVARGSKAKAGAKEAGEGEGEEAGADAQEGKKKKKGGIKGAFKAVKAFATHPAVAAWRLTLGRSALRVSVLRYPYGDSLLALAPFVFKPRARPSRAKRPPPLRSPFHTLPPLPPARRACASW